MNELRDKKGLDPIYDRVSFAKKREESFDRLADVVREHIQLDAIYQKMKEFQKGACHVKDM
jgi:adenosylcobyric acid synthase